MSSVTDVQQIYGLSEQLLNRPSATSKEGLINQLDEKVASMLKQRKYADFTTDLLYVSTRLNESRVNQLSSEDMDLVFLGICNRIQTVFEKSFQPPNQTTINAWNESICKLLDPLEERDLFSFISSSPKRLQKAEIDSLKALIIKERINVNYVTYNDLPFIFRALGDQSLLQLFLNAGGDPNYFNPKQSIGIKRKAVEIGEEVAKEEALKRNDLSTKNSVLLQLAFNDAYSIFFDIALPVLKSAGARLSVYAKHLLYFSAKKIHFLVEQGMLLNTKCSSAAEEVRTTPLKFLIQQTLTFKWPTRGGKSPHEVLPIGHLTFKVSLLVFSGALRNALNHEVDIIKQSDLFGYAETQAAYVRVKNTHLKERVLPLLEDTKMILQIQKLVLEFLSDGDVALGLNLLRECLNEKTEWPEFTDDVPSELQLSVSL